jgi:SAM-dependent methyltransferase
MSKRVCPWWLGYFLASPLRRWLEDPEEILADYVRKGMTVLEPGPGMGFFTTELARRVGESGRVIAVDLQPRMLNGLKRRLQKAGLADRVDVARFPGHRGHRGTDRFHPSLRGSPRDAKQRRFL